MLSINSVFSMQTGIEFEDEFISIVREKVSCERASVEEDHFQGTDLRIEGIPCDVTFFFSGKNFCQKVGSVGDWTLGIRTSNGHGKFEEPVMVIGMDCEAKFASQFVIPNMRKFVGNVDLLATIISDTYWKWVDDHED